VLSCFVSCPKSLIYKDFLGSYRTVCLYARELLEVFKMNFTRKVLSLLSYVSYCFEINDLDKTASCTGAVLFNLLSCC
jgi:hypothetical protein